MLTKKKKISLASQIIGELLSYTKAYIYFALYIINTLQNIKDKKTRELFHIKTKYII